MKQLKTKASTKTSVTLAAAQGCARPRRLRLLGVLCGVTMALALLYGCGTETQEPPVLPSSPSSDVQSTSEKPLSKSSESSPPPPVQEPPSEGRLLVTDELLLERYDPDNPEHHEGRATTASEPRVNLTVRVVDPEGKPVPMLSCDLGTKRVMTDSKGEARFVALYNDPDMLSVINGKSGMNIAGNTDYWVDYRLTILEDAEAPVLELTWVGITPQQTIEAAADRIEICVVDKGGKPVKGAKLWLAQALKEGEPNNEMGIPPMLTDENGVFIWCGFSKGDYNLTCQVDEKFVSERFRYDGGILKKTVNEAAVDAEEQKAIENAFHAMTAEHRSAIAAEVGELTKQYLAGGGIVLWDNLYHPKYAPAPKDARLPQTTADALEFTKGTLEYPIQVKFDDGKYSFLYLLQNIRGEWSIEKVRIFENASSKEILHPAPKYTTQELDSFRAYLQENLDKNHYTYVELFLNQFSDVPTLGVLEGFEDEINEVIDNFSGTAVEMQWIKCKYSRADLEMYLGEIESLPAVTKNKQNQLRKISSIFIDKDMLSVILQEDYSELIEQLKKYPADLLKISVSDGANPDT